MQLEHELREEKEKESATQEPYEELQTYMQIVEANVEKDREERGEEMA